MSNIPEDVLRNLIPAFCGPNGGGVLTGNPAKPISCNPGALTIDRAHYAALWLETLLFGFFVALYGVCLWIFYKRHRPFTSVAWALLAISTTMFALASAHISISLFRNLESSFGDASPLLYSGFSDPGFLSKNVIYIVQTILSDAFLTYRCWVIWGKNWKVASVPLFLIIAHTVVGFVLVAGLGTPKKPSSTEFDDEYIALFSTYLVLTLVANGSATALIGYRVWKVRSTLTGTMRKGTPVAGPNLGKVMEVLLESGTAYSIALIALLVTYVSKSNSHFIVLDSMTPFIGIVFTAIIIRVAMGRATNNTTELRWSTAEKALPRGSISSGSSSVNDGLSGSSISVGSMTKPPINFPQQSVVEGRV